MSNIEGVDSAMNILSKRSQGNQLDYQFVMDCLKDFGAPRAKLGRLLKSGALIPLKKGLYLLGEHFKHNPYCLELIANMIHGPSYVSLEYALQHYGMIPEHVFAITSVTFKLNKEVQTPIGTFIYAHCHPQIYAVGITAESYSSGENFLIATPEKALTDTLTLRRGKITSVKEMEQILLEDLRIEEDDLRTLSLEKIREIQDAHAHSAIHFLEKWLLRLKGNKR